MSKDRVRPSVSAPTWWLVFLRELGDLWIGGKALNLILLYSILLGIYTYVFASNKELSLIPPKEMVYEMLKGAIAVAIFIAMIIGADSLSGERERATLEGLLLIPASRRQIVVGKFLAAVSPWPAALAVSVPYLRVLSQGDPVLAPAVLWCAVLGTTLTLGFTALGMFVSFWCNTNKTSMFVSLGLYALFLLPGQTSKHFQAGSVGLFLQWVNPMEAPRMFLAKTLVNNRTLAEYWTWLLSPAVFALLVLCLLFWYASPGLRLEAGRARSLPRLSRAVTGVSAVAWLIASLSPSAVLARQAAPREERTASPRAERPPLEISIDMDYRVVKAGESILYNTIVTNNGPVASPPLIVAMNIINLTGRKHAFVENIAPADPVDPEDWSPERTQYIESVAPGQSVKNPWKVNAILDGNYMVYMVVIPQPNRPEATSQVVASSGIHLTVTPFTKLNPGGVLPYAIGGPTLLGLGIFLLYRRRRRGIEAGESS